MADDLLEGVLGGDDEKSEAEAPQAVAGAEAFAMAVAARLSCGDPEVARDTSTFLKKQAHLLDLQARHVEEEHASRLAHLRLTVGAAKRKRYADYMRNALYTCVALLVLGMLLAVVRMTVEAMSDQGLIVQDFTVPSDLAARGVTGQAFAEGVASRVAAIRAFTNSISITYSGEVRADQAGVLKVQIPETGISIDELEHFLHRWLGHQTVVNGQLVGGTGGQLSLVLHIGSADPISVSGSSTDLHALVQTAAEKAFAVFDPVNDVIYLGAAGRPAEAYAAAQRYVNSSSLTAPSSLDRAAAYTLLAHADPDARRALSSALVATDIDPRDMVSWWEAAGHSQSLGHDAAAVDYARKSVELTRQDLPVSERGAYPMIVATVRKGIDQAMGDFAAVWDDYEVVDHRFGGLQRTDYYAQRAEVAALLHDQAAARQDLALALAAGSVDDTVLRARWDVSSSTGDWAQALDAAQALVTDEEAQKLAALKSDPQHPEFAARYDLAVATQFRPLVAYADAMSGDIASATALISQTPTDCYLCVRTRAKVAATSGDATTADHWFAEAVSQAPDLPMAYYEWGQALLARGDLAGAAREMSLAHEKGLHFADPLKGLGDVLAKQGHWSDAVAKYDEALKYAPHWSALQHARDAATGKQKT